MPAGSAHPDNAGTTGDKAAAAGSRRHWLIRHWQIPLFIVMLTVAYLTLRDHLPSLHSVGQAVKSASLAWIIAAALCETVSLGMFARQQRALLAAVAVRMSMARAVAITYARSALAISVPAGSAVSAAFAFGQYRRAGATNDKAAAVMVLSAVVSFIGLGGLYLAGIFGLLLARPTDTIDRHPALIIGTAAAIVLAIIALGIRRYQRSRRTSVRSVAATGPTTRLALIRISITATIETWRSLRPRDWIVAVGCALANWFTDLLCLASAARAFALPVSLFTIATMYLGVQIVRQLPITPGGIGLIETGLLAGLTHAGANAGAAAAAVLTYRIFSCWLIIPIGGLAWLTLRARPIGESAGLEPAPNAGADPISSILGGSESEQIA